MALLNFEITWPTVLFIWFTQELDYKARLTAFTVVKITETLCLWKYFCPVFLWHLIWKQKFKIFNEAHQLFSEQNNFPLHSNLKFRKLITADFVSTFKLLNIDIPLTWTLSMAPLVSILKRFDCITFSRIPIIKHPPLDFTNKRHSCFDNSTLPSLHSNSVSCSVGLSVRGLASHLVSCFFS